MRAAAAVLAVLPAVATAQDGQSREALLTALAMNECAVAEDETADVFGAQGFDPEFARHELGQMVLDGTAFLERGRVLRVRADACPPADPAPTPGQAFRQAIVENGCSINDRDARALGIAPERMAPVVEAWLDAGTATLDGRVLTLEECP